jgi:hypothetical protein
MVVCLLLDPRFAVSSPAEDDGFLRAIYISLARLFWGELKLSVACRKILRHVKDPYNMKGILRRQNLSAISSLSFSCFAAKCLRW